MRLDRILASASGLGTLSLLCALPAWAADLNLDIQELNPQTAPGLYDAFTATFFLRHENQSGTADATFRFGPANTLWDPLTGDWNGDGRTTAGLYDPATASFYLRNRNQSGPADITFRFGPPNSALIPLTGDWDRNGTTTIGLYDPLTATFFLRNANQGDKANTTFRFGPASRGWIPLTGDWDGDGRTTVGLYDPETATFFLRNANQGGNADITFRFGPMNSGWLPLTGDWDGDGRDTVGLYDPATAVFHLRNANQSGPADLNFQYGPSNRGWLPLAGAWTKTTLYVFDRGIGSELHVPRCIPEQYTDCFYGYASQYQSIRAGEIWSMRLPFSIIENATTYPFRVARAETGEGMPNLYDLSITSEPGDFLGTTANCLRAPSEMIYVHDEQGAAGVDIRGSCPLPERDTTYYLNVRPAVGYSNELFCGAAAQDCLAATGSSNCDCRVQIMWTGFPFSDEETVIWTDQNGLPIHVPDCALDAQRLFKVLIPKVENPTDPNQPRKAVDLEITTGGGLGNPDLYVQSDLYPTTLNCASANPGTDERCTIRISAAQTNSYYHIRVVGTAAFEDVSLTATWKTVDVQ